jgi:phage baseplate assembly protein W
VSNLYSDVNQYDPTTKPLLVDVESIYQSLHNILTTQRYERLFNNDFGVDFEDMLFELIDDASALEILRLIAQRIEIYEPRVNLNYSNTEVIPDPDNNRFTVKLVFSIKGQEELGDVEFSGIIAASA